MSRPQGHRKSQSTSALNVLASASTSYSTSSNLNRSTATATPRSRRTQGSTRLGSVVEDDSERDDLSHSHSHSTSNIHGDHKEGLDGLLGMISSRTPRKERHQERGRSSDGLGLGLGDLRAAVGDIRSLRSSERRRLAALRTIERIFVTSCAGTSSISLSALMSAELHIALISLLTRHAQTLSHRAAKTHTTLSASDSLANALKDEMVAIFAILQGLCLVDRKSKSEMGQSWMLETIIDLLLVLRAQGAPEGEKPVVYLMLDLLCCVLVDSPTHSRTFESLNGLEAVVRVLKGTGVAKVVRMKCIEFLYFYLLPEQSLPPQRNTSASSTSTSSSAESQLYPPTPINEDTDLLECPATPSRRNRDPTSTSDKKAYSDLDIAFIPQTPRRPHEPSLGYLTPSTRRVSASSSTSLSVPPSPCGPPRSPSHRRLMSVTDTSDSDNSGLGLGLPRSDTAKLISREIPAIKLPTPDVELSNPFNTTSSHTTSTSSGSSTVMPGSRGISRSSTHSAMSSASGGISRTSSMRRISNPPSSRERSADESNGESRERAPKVRHSMSAQTAQMTGASRPEPSKPSARVSHSRSSIQLSDATSPTEERRPSQHRVSRSGTSAQLSELISGPSDGAGEARSARRASVHPSSIATPRSARPMSRSSTSAQLGSMANEPSTDHSRPPKPRQSFSHTRTPSAVNSARGLSVDTSMPPPPSPNTSMAPPPSPNTSMPPPPSPNTSMPPPPVPKPTPRKGFPAGITKGLPSAVSSPNFNSPLIASKRIPSGKLAAKRSNSKLKEVKSVEEKKELLGQWLGNVDALVQGVEKVSFWGSVPKR